jgi:hypothetical protein
LGKLSDIGRFRLPTNRTFYIDTPGKYFVNACNKANRRATTSRVKSFTSQHPPYGPTIAD